MKTTQYVRQEKAIAAADSGGIRERWFWGLRLLRDPEAFNSGSSQLKPGVTDQLIATAKSAGLKLSASEVQRRLRCARTYPTEAEIASVLTEFETWSDLLTAGFPAFEVPAGEPPADHRTATEREAAQRRAMLDLVGEQGAFFPADDYEPITTTLKELVEYAEQQEELTARFVAHGKKRRDYIDSLIEAADNDLSMTWQDAHNRLDGDDDIPGQVAS